jgi:hypothetical protein
MVILPLVVIFGFIIVGLSILYEKSKTKKYREYIADLFVAGKIRQYASNDKIDLEKEEMNFLNWDKKKRNTQRALDNVVENELNERITEDTIELDKSKRKAKESEKK